MKKVRPEVPHMLAALQSRDLSPLASMLPLLKCLAAMIRRVPHGKSYLGRGLPPGHVADRHNMISGIVHKFTHGAPRTLPATLS